MFRKILLPVVFLTLLVAVPMTAALGSSRSNLSLTPAIAPASLQIYYAGPHTGVWDALALAGFKITSDPQQAQAFVFNGSLAELPAVQERLKAGAGLLLILGPEITASQVSALLGIPVTLQPKEDPLSLSDARPTLEAVQTEVIWNSAPQVRQRSELNTSSSSLQQLVIGYENNSLALGKLQVGQGVAYVFTPYLADANPQIQDWAYFNYLVYHLVMRVAGLSPLTFAAYPGSPVPHAAERNWLFVFMGVVMAISILAFVLVRRYSLAHPEALDVMVGDRTTFTQREAQTQWEEIGFHRPLGGFLLALMMGLVMFIPLIIYQNLILPRYILPSAQALGIWGRVTQFFNLAWTFFDMGTSIAFIKYMSEYRVNDPRKGIQFGQVFVWWQALSGAVQVALVVALATTLAPHSAYAIYSWSIIIHSMIQIPGFYQVMRHALLGLQRFDYAQVLDLSSSLVLPMFVQPLIVTIFFRWGQANPAMGGSMGGLIGMGVAAYAVEALTFAFGYWLYRRIGFNAYLLFMAHFDWEVVRKSFAFGVFEMLGSLSWAVGQAAEIWITQSRLINYTEIWGNWGLAQNFIFSYQVLQTIYTNLIASISESISHGRVILSQYYEVMAYKWGGLVSAFIGAVLLAVADRFILGASGPEFARAASYSIPLIIWGAIQYPSWVGDTVQLASNQPYLKATLVTGEQVLRIILALLLLQKMQIYGLIVAYFIGLATKDVVAYFVNNKLCFPQRFYFWQSLTAPFLAGATHYLVLRWFTGLIWKGDEITSVLIFFLGILPSFPLFAFFYGLFGGWDDATLEELHKSIPLSSFMWPLAWLFWASTRLGARLSPLHNRFPITIRPAALDEARGLMDEKVAL